MKAKQCLTSAPVLAHYNPALPIILAGDVSAYGVGAVISHSYPDGSERLIAYASHQSFTRQSFRNAPFVKFCCTFPRQSFALYGIYGIYMGKVMCGSLVQIKIVSLVIQYISFSA